LNFLLVIAGAIELFISVGLISREFIAIIEYFYFSFCPIYSTFVTVSVFFNINISLVQLAIYYILMQFNIRRNIIKHSLRNISFKKINRCRKCWNTEIRKTRIIIARNRNFKKWIGLLIHLLLHLLLIYNIIKS